MHRAGLVAVEVVAGQGDRREMFVSEATVKTHLNHILAKLAMQDRASDPVASSAPRRRRLSCDEQQDAGCRHQPGRAQTARFGVSAPSCRGVDIVLM